MTPADILASARAKPMSPVVPARGKGWIGPVCFSDGEEAAIYGTNSDGTLCHVVLCADGRALGYTVTSLHLDLRRPEVRDHLVRCGAPEWFRDSVAGLMAWTADTRRPRMVLRAWDDSWAPRADRWSASPTSGICVCSVIPEEDDVFPAPRGWHLAFVSGRGVLSGPETGPEGRACADLAALHVGCVLTEADGWYIPLPGGDVGWLPKESA